MEKSGAFLQNLFPDKTKQEKTFVDSFSLGYNEKEIFKTYFMKTQFKDKIWEKLGI